MSDELKAKLREIIYNYADHPDSFETSTRNFMEEAITQIDQAFKEAGYVHSDAREKADELVNQMQDLLEQSQHQLMKLKMSSGYVFTRPDELEKVMTGQEWYERFEKELASRGAIKTEYDKRNTHLHYDDAIYAAKRAAGLQ